MAEPTELLSNVHVIEELIQLPDGSDTVVIANSYNNFGMNIRNRERPRTYSKLWRA